MALNLSVTREKRGKNQIVHRLYSKLANNGPFLSPFFFKIFSPRKRKNTISIIVVRWVMGAGTWKELLEDCYVNIFAKRYKKNRGSYRCRLYLRILNSVISDVEKKQWFFGENDVQSKPQRASKWRSVKINDVIWHLMYNGSLLVGPLWKRPIVFSVCEKSINRRREGKKT